MRKVLNTMVQAYASQNKRLKFIYWGASVTQEPLDNAAVIALDGTGTGTGRELRIDRKATLVNINGALAEPVDVSKYLVVCTPVEFGGDGYMRVNEQTTNQFDIINTIVGFVDDNGDTYDMNVFMSHYKINGVITSLRIL